MRAIFTVLPLLPLVLFGCGSSDSTAPASPDTDSGSAAETAPVDAGETGSSCTSARDTAIGPVDKTSGALVKVLDDTAGVKTVFIDATAGGISGGKTNPWVYVKLATSARVDVTDGQAFASTEWDLALKRASIFTNSGDGGPGKGGARLLSKSFDAVTVADATSLKVETWFDAECTPLTDAIGGIKTTFDGWYTYDGATSKVTAKDVTFVVAAADGALYKLAIQTYYGTPTGGTATSGANYIVKYAALK